MITIVYYIYIGISFYTKFLLFSFVGQQSSLKNDVDLQFKLSSDMLGASVTVNEPKMFLVIIDNLLLTAKNIMLAYLVKKGVNIELYDDFDEIFSSFCRYNGMGKEFVTCIEEMRLLIEAHKESNFEFSRNNEFVICTSDFETRKISIGLMKKYISTVGLLITETWNHGRVL